MTEDEWARNSDPTPMLELLRGRAGGRKLRLFALACCRRVWPLLDAANRAVVLAAESYADGALGSADLEVWRAEAEPEYDDDSPGYMAGAAARLAAHPDLWFAVDSARAWAADAAEGAGLCADEDLEQARLLRDIFGPTPFRETALNPGWLTSTVVQLARGIYKERAFDRLPILADALQDAGCTNDDILDHCRGGGAARVRGCWVVDLALGKE